MQKYIIDFFKFIIKETKENKLFAVMGFVIMFLVYTNIINERNHKRDIDYCNRRRDIDRDNFQKENKAVYNMLVNKYEKLYNETKELSK